MDRLSISKAVYEGVKDLHEVGLMGDKQFHELKEHCLSPDNTPLVQGSDDYDSQQCKVGNAE